MRYQSYLVADIGGTNSRFQAWTFQPQDQVWQCLWDQRYASEDFASFDRLLNRVAQDAPQYDWSVVVVGVAGPVRDHCVQFTNLNWSIARSDLVACFTSSEVFLLNDFTIAAYALDHLTSSDYQVIQSGSSSLTHGARLLIGAGTGLGVAFIQHEGAELIVNATEAGHIDFAPLDPLDKGLQAWLEQSWRHVSFERLVSGDGLVAIYQFLADYPIFNPHLGPTAGDIAKQAEDGDAIALNAVLRFWGYYGQFIGNMTLCWPASGGVYIAGGMAPKLVRWLKDSEFFERLLQKGRMTPLVRSSHLFLVTEPDLGLMGARHYASYVLHST